MMIDIFNGNGVEILLPDSESFLKIKETLTRIGILSKKDNTLFQSCHILHKKGLYAILHFKELFLMDGKNSDISENDISRRNTIVSLLQDWGLLTIVHPELIVSPRVEINQIKILSYKDKSNYNLVAKYEIGRHQKY